jgi:hypothetical protein
MRSLQVVIAAMLICAWPLSASGDDEDSDKDNNLIKTKIIEIVGDDLICEGGVVFLGKLYEKIKLDTNFSDCIDC